MSRDAARRRDPLAGHRPGRGVHHRLCVLDPYWRTILIFAIPLYVAAIVAANLLVLKFGPAITPINAFFLIGLDLALRNWLNLRMRPVHMGALILSTGVITYLLNPASQAIAVASAVAFTCAALADWLTFRTVAGSWMRKNLAGAGVGAAVDSLIFPTLAFGTLLPAIVLLQFVAKMAGGALWAWVLRPKAIGVAIAQKDTA